MKNAHPALIKAFSIWLISEQIYNKLEIRELASLCLVIEGFAALPRDHLLKRCQIKNAADIFCLTVVRVVKTISKQSSPLAITHQ